VGILIVVLCSLIIISGSILICKYNKLIIGIPILCLLVPIIGLFGNPPTYSNMPDKYRYGATIYMNENAWENTIYFAEFEQNGNIVTIEKYAVKSTHLTSFIMYDIVEEPLDIVLLNNKNFIYRDRFTKELFGVVEYTNKPIATQR